MDGKVKQTDTRDTRVGETARNLNISAENSNTRIETLKETFRKLSNEDYAEIARDPTTPRFILAMLAEYPSWYIREEVAKNLHTSRHTLAKLAKVEKDPIVLQAVAGNLHTSRHTLEKLAKNPHWFVQLEVAKNLHTSRFTLTRLAENPFGDVSRAAKANPNITKEEIEKLAKYVEIYDNIETLFRKIKDIFVDIGYSLADLFLDKGYMRRRSVR